MYLQCQFRCNIFDSQHASIICITKARVPTLVLGRDFLQIPLPQQYLIDLTQRICHGDSPYWHKLYICVNGNHMVNIFQLIFQGCKNYRRIFQLLESPQFELRFSTDHIRHIIQYKYSHYTNSVQGDPFHFPPQALNSKQPPSIRNYLFSLNFE